MHSNSGVCLGCAKIFNRYPGFYEPLKDWFFKAQAQNPTFHVNCAGRGKFDQEAAFARGASNAHWLESAHNFNAAIDTFFMINGQYRLDPELYAPIYKSLDPEFEWFGRPGAPFYERPHFELKAWNDLVNSGQLHSVE